MKMGSCARREASLVENGVDASRPHTYVMRRREKLGRAGASIRAVRGVGHRLVSSPRSANEAALPDEPE